MTQPSIPVAIPKRTQSARLENWSRAFYRFRQSWLSVIGLAIVVALIVIAILAPWIVPHPEHVAGGTNTAARFQPPSAIAWFGTNALGQDMFSLVLVGSQVSLFSGLAVVFIAIAVGTVVGAIAGYFGGWIDEILMRITDLLLTIPSLILAMAVAAALGTGVWNMIIAISITWWPAYARLVRGEVIVKKEEQFVVAAHALGANWARILGKHILPNIVSPIVIKASLDMGFAILTVASLGFVGIGVKPPTPEWGTLLSGARSYMPDYWWTAVAPGIAIFLAVLAFNLLGDGLRDVLDPKARR
ncbi:ABC transporter permease [Xaviernesmea oryzae]|uniref:Peptide/nickel transport system permease protein n=1 Tax=Xaviernesmea oryzae TaxID=464029 RepID=A0A1X7DMS3_9HYPH|nr:ABC transporter permease [Xaviernesmea oryzae]SMF18044.1 peptide/nickel transport system permease protein [Xaviernesmea oryzae]